MESTFEIHSPFGLIISGPSQIGKTYKTLEIIKKRKEFIKPPLNRVIYFYNFLSTELQDLAATDKDLKLVSNFSEALEILEPRDLFVVDDHGDKLTTNKDFLNELTLFFTTKIHHLKISVILILQNLYTKNVRHLSLNSNYLILFPTRRDSTIFLTLGRQVREKIEEFFDHVIIEL